MRREFRKYRHSTGRKKECMSQFRKSCTTKKDCSNKKYSKKMRQSRPYSRN